MKEAERLFRDGKLGAAIDSLQAHLRSNPGDVTGRMFLFELLCFQGDFQRAWKQVDVVDATSEKPALGLDYYKQVIRAEQDRQKQWQAGEHRAEVGNASVSGTLNGEAFRHLEDADPRLGARLEVIVGTRYFRVPFSELSVLRVTPPRFLRDLVWAPAGVEARQSQFAGDSEVLLPSLTPLAWQHPDENVRLGRVTVWEEVESGDEVPMGQKLLLVDGEEFPLLEVRDLVLNVS